ncbi:MAG: agmatine deiminase family protein [Rubripirellula sp.]|nr:agmatine deiminase family protein [Rubripirellula sp.]
MTPPPHDIEVATSGPLDSSSRRRVPAEWEPQKCLWLAWPHNQETWPGRFEPIPPLYVRWANLVAESTPVRILASGSSADRCRHAFGHTLPSGIRIVDIATNDCWIRDYGPTFVHDPSSESIQAVNWHYNAWGGKYPPWDHDDAAAQQMCRSEGIVCHEGRLCIEGGGMEFDGRGRMLTTDCFLSRTRNPGSNKEQIARSLYSQLGVDEIVWVETTGLQGDDTDGHIDQLARFIDEQNVVVASSKDRQDPNYETLDHVYRQLKLWGQSTEPGVTVHPLPIPPAREIHGKRVPESYCNFLRLGPDRLIVPAYGASTDDEAATLLRELSGADVDSLDCRDLIWGLGAIHCASRDMPKCPTVESTATH